MSVSRSAFLAKQPARLSATPWAPSSRIASLYASLSASTVNRTHSIGTVCAAQQTMEPKVQTLVERLHQTPNKAVIYATGGGSQALSWLLSVPGASNTVLEASVPYSRGSLVDILGFEPSQYCCQETAVLMAKAAYRRAANLTPLGTPVVGISATCSLATDRPKRGDHHAHIAAHTGLTTHIFNITLSKNSRSRWAEDALVSKLLLQAVATASDLQLQPGDLPLDLVTGDITAAAHEPQPPATPQQLAPSGEEPEEDVAAAHQQQQPSQLAPAGEEPEQQPSASTPPQPSPATANGKPPRAPQRYTELLAAGATPEAGRAPVHPDKVLVLEQHLGDPLEALLAGKVRSVEYSKGLQVVDAPRRRRVYLPGSFNPVHEGHIELLQKACAMAGPDWEGCFELSVGNADKGMLELAEIQRRVAQFTEADLPLVVTSAPLFVQKAELFPGSKFVVGYDTAVRLVMPKYHNNSFTEMVIEFGNFRHLQCSFIVAGRVDGGTGQFRGLRDANVPAELKDLFSGLPEGVFRRDISSTEIRRRMSEALAEESSRGSGLTGGFSGSSSEDGEQ